MTFLIGTDFLHPYLLEVNCVVVGVVGSVGNCDIHSSSYPRAVGPSLSTAQYSAGFWSCLLGIGVYPIDVFFPSLQKEIISSYKNADPHGFQYLNKVFKGA